MTSRQSLDGGAISHRAFPCTRCPWRMDADLTDFSDTDMDMLRRADGRPGAEAAPSAPTVACHLDQPGTSHAYRLCAGWLAVVGSDHVAVRLALLTGALPGHAVTPGADWPRLYASLDALLKARQEQLGGEQGAQ